MNSLVKQLERMEQDAVARAKYQRDLGNNEQAMMHELGEGTGLRNALVLLRQTGIEIKAVRVLKSGDDALEEEVYVRAVKNLFTETPTKYGAYIRIEGNDHKVTVNEAYAPIRATEEEALADARASVEFEHGWVEPAPLGDDPMGDA